MKFLILTDHRGHSDQNSLYALARTLVADPRCTLADVASRGTAANADFFTGDHAQVQGFRIESGFDFPTARPKFEQATTPLPPVEDYDVIWLRLPHPVPASFFDYLSGLSGPTVINNPAGLVEVGSKDFLLSLPEWTAPTALPRSAGALRELVARFPVVLKPLRDYGGRGIVRLNDEPDIAAFLPDHEAELVAGNYLAMKFLKNVSEGDKRILVVNGKILASSLRLPREGGWLCNVAQGGTSVAAEVTDREREMVAALAPVLREKGVIFCGIDTLVADDGRRVLSEINTLSIGGFPQAEAQTGRPVLQSAIDGVFEYLSGRPHPGPTLREGHPSPREEGDDVTECIRLKIKL